MILGRSSLYRPPSTNYWRTGKSVQTEWKIRVNTAKKRELNRKFETLGSLSNDDGDGIENGKKGIG